MVHYALLDVESTNKSKNEKGEICYIDNGNYIAYNICLTICKYSELNFKNRNTSFDKKLRNRRVMNEHDGDVLTTVYTYDVVFSDTEHLIPKYYKGKVFDNIPKVAFKDAMVNIGILVVKF